MFTRHKMRENALALSILESICAKQHDSNTQTNDVTVDDAVNILCSLAAARARKIEDALH